MLGSPDISNHTSRSLVMLPRNLQILPEHPLCHFVTHPGSHCCAAGEARPLPNRRKRRKRCLSLQAHHHHPPQRSTSPFYFIATHMKDSYRNPQFFERFETFLDVFGRRFRISSHPYPCLCLYCFSAFSTLFLHPVLPHSSCLSHFSLAPPGVFPERYIGTIVISN